LTLGTWIFLSLELDAYSFFFSEYWSMGPGHWDNLFIRIMAPAPAAAVFKKNH